MKLTTTAAIGFTLLCSVSAPALAQSSQDSCARLQQVTEQNRNRFNGEWVRQAEQVIRARDEQTCHRYAEQGEGAARQLDQKAASNGQQDGSSQSQSQQTAQSTQGNEAAGGQIMVTQPQPEVTVQQQPPQIDVIQPQPQVNVQENKQAEVKVQRAQPEVQLQQQGKPEVQVSQAQPQVSYEAARPKVEVEQAGQPKVEFRQSGQAQVKVGQMQGEQQGAADDQPTGSTSRAALTEQDRERIGVIDANQQKLKPVEVKASQLINKPVVNQKGEKLGTIKAIRREGDMAFAVIDHGGALSLSQREIMVPAQRIAVDGQGRIMLLGLTEQDFTALPKLQADAGEAIKANQTVRISQSQK